MLVLPAVIRVHAGMCRWLRWCGGVPAAVLLVFVSFCVVLPLCCHRLLHSYFFLRSAHLDAMSDAALRRSLQQGRAALRFWQSAAAAAASSSSASAAEVAPRPELLVTVVTARRSDGRDFHYLLQVMRRLRGLLASCGGGGGGGGKRCAEVLLCDVDERNEDAALLERHYRVLRRTPAERRRDRPPHLNTFEREKRDYVFCLRRAWQEARPQNLVVLEDDALPVHDFFGVLGELLSRRFAANTLYVKLYHPERLQRYWNPEPYRLLEWAGLGLVGASAILFCLHFVFPSVSLNAAHLLFFSLYVMAAAELLGRHYLLELRRLHPQLYAVTPATECCTPAMLFPGNASLRAAAYLDAAACVSGDAKDMVLYRAARTVAGETAHSVEPNLISHIGAYSSVRPNPPRPRLL